MGEMREKSDVQLLCEYAAHGNEAAFREIVVRHTDMVYSSALRQATSPDLARDVAQSVFTDLARKAQPLAKSMDENASILGWLFRSTRFAALNQLRDDRRRQARERQVMEHFDPAPETAPEWDRVRPVLDEAMADLNDEDREAVLLRFFKNRDFRAIGQSLGVSDDAAQKRVSRALDRLRTHLASRGVTTTAVALSTALTVNAVQAAPVGLAVTISTGALAGTSIATTATATTVKTIAMTTLQKTIIGATLAAAVGTGVYEARQASTLRTQVQTLRQQQVPLTEEVGQLRGERDEALSKLAAMRQDNERLRQQTTEVLKLRAEVSRLREETRKLAQTKAINSAEAAGNNPFIQSVLSLAARAIELGQLVEQNPDKRIPEFQLLTENDWLEAARKTSSADSESDPRKILNELRIMAKRKMYPAWQQALNSYINTHNDQLPADVFELKPYFESPVDDAILRRYHVANTGSATRFKWSETGKPRPQKIEDHWIIVENAAVDGDYDKLCHIGFGTSAEYR